MVAGVLIALLIVGVATRLFIRQVERDFKRFQEKERIE